MYTMNRKENRNRTVSWSLYLRRACFALGIAAMAAVMCAPAATAGPVSCMAGGAALAPGAFVLPGDCTGSPAGTLLASLTAPFTSTLGLDSGTIVSAVFEESGGTLDFYYQVNLSATSTNCGAVGQPSCDPLGRETDTLFTGFTTSVATRSDGASLSGGIFVNGTAIPVSADRNSTGDVVGFSFTPPCCSSEIQPGTSSLVLVIATDATNFTAGNASVIDGGTTTVAAFEPVSPTPTPEPSSLLLLWSGLLVGGAATRRKLLG
jgi:hypothetical protein